MAVFYVFWGEESENDISFYPSRIDFAVRYNAIFYHLGKWSCQMQVGPFENLCAAHPCHSVELVPPGPRISYLLLRLRGERG